MKRLEIIWIVVLLLGWSACEWSKLDPPPVPPTADPLTKLEAEYTTTAPSSARSSFWTTADYYDVSLTNLVSGNLYDDGFLNMTGLYNGMTSFNGGNDIELRLKAAYDDENIYILASWNDDFTDVAFGTKFWNAESDPLKPAETANEWTAQKNSDSFTFIFEDDSKTDIWKWSAALSDPLGYAIDMNGDFVNDSGELPYEVNTLDNVSANPPRYEWDGESQTVTLKDGSKTILDPAYFLLNKTEFLGNPAEGDIVLDHSCAICHGKNGSGEGDEAWAPAINQVENNRYSRSALVDVITANEHDGNTYFASLSQTQKTDLFARMRSLSGIPAYTLRLPTGSMADVEAYSNITKAKIQAKDNERYTVLFIRKLNTGNADDINFDADKTYKLSLRLTDNDDINYVGSLSEEFHLLPAK